MGIATTSVRVIDGVDRDGVLGQAFFSMVSDLYSVGVLIKFRNHMKDVGFFLRRNSSPMGAALSVNFAKKHRLQIDRRFGGNFLVKGGQV